MRLAEDQENWVRFPGAPPKADAETRRRGDTESGDAEIGEGSGWQGLVVWRVS